MTDKLIQRLTRNQIDDSKWNEAINQSSLPRVYALSWYLDCMTQNQWSALVIGDYDAVFPLYIKYKFGIPYITQPLLCQQLGLFSKIELDESVHKYIIEYIKTHFLKTNILVNASGNFPLDSIAKINHILPINKDYNDISTAYNTNTKRNLKKAANQNLTFSKSTDVKKFVNFISECDKSGRLCEVTEQITQLILCCQELGSGNILTVIKEDTIISGIFYISDEERVYTLIMASDDVGLQSKAMFLLIDHLIKQYFGTKKYLDFFGSNIENIARRNEGFGAIKEVYYLLNLSWRPI